MGAPLINLDQVAVTLGGRHILADLSWQLCDGECAVILGPSGSGKTVFLHVLLGFLTPDEGRVSAPGLPDTDLFESLAVIFQEDALLDERTVEANLAAAREQRADLFSPPFEAQTEAAIDASLREVQLDPARVRRLLPSSLSGGMRRRVALARALIRQPRVLIADEPTSGLDPASSARVYDLLGELIQRRAMSAIIITHDPACASRLGYPVYYFSPVDGRMPRWPTPPPATSPEERHRLLLLWMHEQIAEHTRRQMSQVADEESVPANLGESWLAHLQHTVNHSLDALGRTGLLLGRLVHRPSVVLFLMNLLAWGLKTVPLAALIFLMVGIVMQVQTEAAVVEYGLSNRLPELVALSLLRLSPILIGFIMAGRCGSAISAQTGWMQLAGQFRALRTLRIEPERAFFPPLFWSLVVATPLLALAGLLIGAAGATLVLVSPASQAKITLTYFLSAYPTFLTAGELFVVILKGIFMGGGLAVIAFAEGAQPKRSPADITAAITGGLVTTFLWVALVDTVLSLLIPL